MAFRSKAQRRKFDELLAAGKITKETYAKMEAGTPSKLPERNASYAPKTRRPRRLAK